MKGRLFTWQFVISAYVVLITVFLLAGCSTHHSLRVGDVTYSAGITLNKHEDINLD